MEQKEYWKGLEELHEDPEFLNEQDKEFVEELPEELFSSVSSIANAPTSRRDFLKYLGFSLSAATLAASCRIPVNRAIPYVIKPEEIVPGVANYYASSFIDGNDYCPVLVKVRDGRPIKIEPLTSKHIADDSANRFFFGGTNARTQASILSLYDMSRPQQPTVTGKKATWEVVDSEIREKLQKSKGSNGNIRLLTPSLLSPSTRQLINDFTEIYPTTKHIVYDPISYAAISVANEKNFGKRIIPGYHFDQANVIVSFGADFLGTWLSPIEYARQYVQNRKVSPAKTEMSRHYQVESRLSITGSNADKRIAVKPSEENLAVLTLYDKLAGMMNGGSVAVAPLNAKADKLLTQAAMDLAANKGKSLVVSGSNDVNVQVTINAINNLLGNYGTTINLNHYSNIHQSDDKGFMELLDEMNRGAVNALIVYGANPVYDYMDGSGFAEAMKKVETTISLNDRTDETTVNCRYHCPDHHYLESWNDAEPRSGLFTMCQPTIWPLFKTRQAQDSLMRWMGNTDDYYTYIRKNWEKTVYPNQSMYSDFQTFWDNCVKEGVIEISASSASPGYGDKTTSVSAIDVNQSATALSQSAGSRGMELVLYEKVGAGNGRYANNPWLQELPDPVSKIVWDNYLCVSPKYAKDNGLSMDMVEHNTDIVKVTAGNKSVEVPVYIAPGQCDNSFSLALGYGRTRAGRSGNGIGQNAFSLVTSNGETCIYNLSNVSVSKTGKRSDLAMTQTHFSFEGRDVIQERTITEYQKNPDEGKDEHDELKKLWGETLYPTQKFPGARWAMSIDLNSCIGCGTCAVACQSENNIPVVGKTEVRRVHEMAWLRIDRYYSFPSAQGLITEEKKYDEIPDYQDVQVTFQPMLCQHCANAPCENVCPVSATNHSSEGLNQMAYNRCIGTRYCANNCPYKVRRFNWLDYTGADVFPWNEPWNMPTYGIQNPQVTDAMTRMVLNPDVTVRSRGVMEKCTFCVQRIQDGKLSAKKEDRPLKDGDIVTACQAACPADAIVFGNINDHNTEVWKMHDDARAYYVLADINTRPSIAYMRKVRNKSENINA